MSTSRLALLEVYVLPASSRDNRLSSSSNRPGLRAEICAGHNTWKLGAKNWLFVGSELAGQRAAVVMSLVQSAKLNKIDPWAYLRDVLARIHTHPASRIDELLPHRWQPS